LTLNPEKLRNTGRKECCRKIEGLIILVTHPSRSKQRKHKNFTKIMDNSDNYPVLIHMVQEELKCILLCTVSSMRSLLMKPHQGVRTLLKFSSFDDGTPKGEYKA
jgi:hypothetical protein